MNLLLGIEWTDTIIEDASKSIAALLDTHVESEAVATESRSIYLHYQNIINQHSTLTFLSVSCILIECPSDQIF